MWNNQTNTDVSVNSPVRRPNPRYGNPARKYQSRVVVGPRFSTGDGRNHVFRNAQVVFTKYEGEGQRALLTLPRYLTKNIPTAREFYEFMHPMPLFEKMSPRCFRRYWVHDTELPKGLFPDQVMIAYANSAQTLDFTAGSTVLKVNEFGRVGSRLSDESRKQFRAKFPTDPFFVLPRMATITKKCPRRILTNAVAPVTNDQARTLLAGLLPTPEVSTDEEYEYSSSDTSMEVIEEVSRVPEDPPAILPHSPTTLMGDDILQRYLTNRRIGVIELHPSISLSLPFMASLGPALSTGDFCTSREPPTWQWAAERPLPTGQSSFQSPAGARGPYPRQSGGLDIAIVNPPLPYRPGHYYHQPLASRWYTQDTQEETTRKFCRGPKPASLRYVRQFPSLYKMVKQEYDSRKIERQPEVPEVILFASALDAAPFDPDSSEDHFMALRFPRHYERAFRDQVHHRHAGGDMIGSRPQIIARAHLRLLQNLAPYQCAPCESPGCPGQGLSFTGLQTPSDSIMSASLPGEEPPLIAGLRLGIEDQRRERFEDLLRSQGIIPVGNTQDDEKLPYHVEATSPHTSGPHAGDTYIDLASD